MRYQNSERERTITAIDIISLRWVCENKMAFGIDVDRDGECFRVRDVWVKKDDRNMRERKKERGGRGLIIFLFTIFC